MSPKGIRLHSEARWCQAQDLEIARSSLPRGVRPQSRGLASVVYRGVGDGNDAMDQSISDGSVTEPSAFAGGGGDTPSMSPRRCNDAVFRNSWSSNKNALSCVFRHMHRRIPTTTTVNHRAIAEQARGCGRRQHRGAAVATEEHAAPVHALQLGWRYEFSSRQSVAASTSTPLMARAGAPESGARLSTAVPEHG